MIFIDTNSKQPLYIQIYNCFISDIQNQVLKAHKRLPSSRQIAEELSVSRNTITHVYEQLETEGYIYAKPRSGFYVSELKSLTARPSHTIQYLIADKNSATYDYAYGTILNALFPYNQWQKCINHALQKMETENCKSYPEKSGAPDLRNAIAYYLSESRGVACSPNNIVITCGSQMSMHIISVIFQEFGKRIIFENPGYDGAWKVFQDAGYEIIDIPVESEGISVDALKKSDGDLIYLTPSHQFPTGSILPIQKRLEILNWAKNNRTYIIEDDYDSELRYASNPIPSMQSLDLNGNVIYTGTFSKCLSANLRVAYIVFPDSVYQLFQAKYSRYNCQVSTLIQYALAEFMNSHAFSKNIRKLRTHYKKVQDYLIDALYTIFGNHITVYGNGAGLHLLVDFKLGIDSDRLIKSAANVNVKFYSPLDHFRSSINANNNQGNPQSLYRSWQNSILLGFGTIDFNDIHKSLSLVKKAWLTEGYLTE